MNEYHKKVKEKQEYITCAAILLADGVERVHSPINVEKGLVVCGHRHHNCFQTFSEIFVGKRERYLQYLQIQGFLTSKNRFVSREEGADIAFAAQQTERHVQVLYSEDLY